jgi:hypothetical protein
VSCRHHPHSNDCQHFVPPSSFPCSAIYTGNRSARSALRPASTTSHREQPNAYCREVQLQQTRLSSSDAVAICSLHRSRSSFLEMWRGACPHVAHRRMKIERVYRPYLTATEAAWAIYVAIENILHRTVVRLWCVTSPRICARTPVPVITCTPFYKALCCVEYVYFASGDCDTSTWPPCSIL